MTDSFRERADLQRRQIYHQQLLDSQRFGARAEEIGAHSRLEGSGPGGEGGLLGAALWVLAVIMLPITAVSVLASLPAMIGVSLADRALSGYWSASIRETFVATAMGIFVYLMATLLIGIGVCVFHEELPSVGGLHGLSSAMFDLCSRVLDALSAVGSGDLSLARFFGIDGHEADRLLRWMAIFALHGPGVFLGAVALCSRMGSPFSGVRGVAAAVVTSALAIPLSVGWAVWFVARVL